MRIAISGSHRVGKTTLAEALAEALPRHELVPEPYELLEEEGYEFAEMPSVEDFEQQLERSLACLEEAGADVIFDRAPLDLLGYLLTHEDADAVDVDAWLSRVQELITSLDLIVFVPIEAPDRIAVPREQAALRADVDAELRTIVVDDTYGFEVDVITVAGTTAARVQQVLAHLRRAGG